MGMKLSNEQPKRFSQCDYEESKKVWKTEKGPSQDDRACSRGSKFIWFEILQNTIRNTLTVFQ